MKEEVWHLFFRDPRLLRSLLFVFLAMFAAQILGSAFNIGYNVVHIRPLLTNDQDERFLSAISRYNVLVYPPLILVWALRVFHLPLRPTQDPDTRRRVIHLPWWALFISAAGWLGCIPFLQAALHQSPDPLDPRVLTHLPLSILTAALISVPLGFLTVDLLCQSLLYPFYFQDTSPWKTPGARSLRLPGRGVFWLLSASVAPVVTLLLLALAAQTSDDRSGTFALTVAGVCLSLALAGTVLLARLVVLPINRLTAAAQSIGEGDLSTRVNLLRADEFGVLGDEFNRMASGLQEREEIRETFGRHVGSEVARQLLAREGQTEGRQEVLSILFSDIRGYTTVSESLRPEQSVTLLNLFHGRMTEIIEQHHGIIAQIVGDGYMAIFGAASDTKSHADEALQAGRDALAALPELNRELENRGFAPIRIGIGIHTGPAIVGSIGSPRRQEFTAVGDVVNTASRIESLTKELATPLVFSQETLDALSHPPDVCQLPPRSIRGKRKLATLYTLDDLSPS